MVRMLLFVEDNGMGLSPVKLKRSTLRLKAAILQPIALTAIPNQASDLQMCMTEYVSTSEKHTASG